MKQTPEIDADGNPWYYTAFWSYFQTGEEDYFHCIVTKEANDDYKGVVGYTSESKRGDPFKRFTEREAILISEAPQTARERDELEKRVALLAEALTGYRLAVDVMNEAMKDGINVHGALSQLVAYDELSDYALQVAASPTRPTWSDWYEVPGDGVNPLPWALPHQYEVLSPHGGNPRTQELPATETDWNWHYKGLKVRYRIDHAPEGFFIEGLTKA